jgi:hypothetical protein
MWPGVLLNPLVLSWILFSCINSYIGSSSSDYIDVSPLIPSFWRDPFGILVFLVPFLLDLSQECWAVFYVMVYYMTVHTCHWWKWTIPCIISCLLVIVAHYWSSTSSKYSSASSSTFVSTSISSSCIVLGYLVILCEVILWLCMVILLLCILVLLFHIIA